MARILVLEPEPEVRDLFAHLLAHVGHSVAGDGEQPDALLVEAADPASRQHALDLVTERPGLPVVVATIDDTHGCGAELSPAVVLVKPIGAERLRVALERALAPT